MSMYFLDETDDWPEYETIREEIHRLDEEHIETSKELKALESALLCDSGNESLKIKLEGLRKRLREIEAKLDGSLSMYR